MKKIWIVVFTMILLMVTTACTNTETNQTKSKEITVYTAIEEDQLDTYLQSFKEQYPNIKVNIVRDSTGVITAKLLAEKENPRADVVWGVAATSLLIAEQKGLLKGYAPEGLNQVKDKFKDVRKKPLWIGNNAWMTAIVVNAVELKERGLPIPQSYEDLLNPKYKGLITMPNPASSGTGFLTVSAFIQSMGDKKAWNYMDQLHQNIGIYTHSGSKPAKLAARGEYPIGVSFGYPGIEAKEKGAPVKVIFPKEGSGWEMEANALVKKDNIKDAAKTFLDWAISKDAMKLYAKNFAITSVKTSKPVPKGYPENPEKQLIDNDFQWAAKHREAILDKWSKRYDTKSEPEE